MKKLILLLLLVGSSLIAEAQNRYEDRFTRPLDEVLKEVAERFDVKLDIDAPIDGLQVPYADFRIRPYSIDETLSMLLYPFDLTYAPTGEKRYGIKPFEYYRRTPADGKKMVDYLLTLYTDRETFEKRAEVIRREAREKLEVDKLLPQRVALDPMLSKTRKYDGYTVTNFALETLPGLYVCGSIYAPAKKGVYPVILCPVGHFNEGRYRQDQQLRMATFARMGAIAVDYDLFGYAESELQVSTAAHRTPYGGTIQIMNGISILDYMATRSDVDMKRVGVTGASGGGQQSVVLSVVDDRFTALCPVVSLSSWFDGGCPCESGMPVTQAAGGTCNAEMAAIFAPRPLCVISDGKDWTAHVPEMEGPFLARIYSLFGVPNRIAFYHYPNEGHDFGYNKRKAVYDFFARAFGLDIERADETNLTLEPMENLLLFGKGGMKLPAEAVRSVEELPRYARERATPLK